MVPQPHASAVPADPIEVLLDRIGHELLTQTDDLVFVIDRQSRLVFVNRAVLRACGGSELQPTLRGLAPWLGDAITRLESVCACAWASAGVSTLDAVWQGGGASGRVFRLRPVVLEDVLLLLQGSDVTEQRQAEERLREREQEFRTLAENSPDNIIRYGLDQRATYCNREIEERVAVEARHVVGRTPAEAAPPGMQGTAVYEQQLARTLASGERGVVELRVPTPEGELRVHSVVISAEYDSEGRICGALAVGRDVTQLAQALDQLAAREREFRSLAQNAGDNIMRWDAQARMCYLNPAMERVLKRPADQLLGLTSLEAGTTGAFVPVHAAVVEVLRIGAEQLIELRFQPAPEVRALVHQIRLVPEFDASGIVCGVLGIGRDLTDVIEQRELIASLARQDPLTRLSNRLVLSERAEGIFAAAKRHRVSAGVMLLDLDGFKAVNDGLGHSAGDTLLCVVAQRLGAVLRADDLLVRLGGDEFVVLAPDIDTPAALAHVAAKLHAALAAPVPVAGRDVHVSASVGAAMFPSDGADLEQLLSHADSAMYQAKRAGRGRTEFYREGFGAAVRRRLVLEQALRAACDSDGLALHYQPQIDARSGRLVGAEALLRWQHDTLGAIGPCEFIPLAEETGLIVPLGDWVLGEAAAAAARWNRPHAALKVAVNVSVWQLRDPQWPQRVAQILQQHGCEPAWLSIEITESVFAGDAVDVQRSLLALRALGLTIELDDFGTGFSALNYLARFPVDGLKIDKSFVHVIGEGERPGELVRAFIAMAQALRLSLVAEGVETDAQASFLGSAGCPVMQGWRYGRAVPAQQFEHDWLQR